MNCNACKEPLSNQGGEAVCGKCKGEYHFQCTTVFTSDAWKKMSSTKRAEWKCNSCIRSKPATRSTSEDDQCNENTMTMFQKLLSKEFSEFEKRMNKKFGDVEKNLEFTSGKLDDMATSVKNIEQKMILIERRQEKIEAENKELKTKIKNLEVEVREMAQAGLNNKLEISGLPNTFMELKDVGKQFMDRVGVDLNTVGQYDVEKPFKPQDRAGTKSSVVMTFRIPEVRNLVFGKVKIDKIRLTTKDLIKNSSDTSLVYVNEYLSPYYRKLFYEAKKVKLEKKYSFLWVRGGKLLLKKSEGSNIIRLTSMDDLGKI